ncbi:MAG: hypothetical protein U1E56_01865 [Bauldia sp.]
MQDIERLNADCTCITLDRDALRRALAEVLGDRRLADDLATTHPHLISAQPLFLSGLHAREMQAIVSAIETVARLPAYRQAIGARVPDIAKDAPGPLGVFMGYDFHLSADGPRLIEINTNAGGALINAYLLAAQQACCSDMAVARATGGDVTALFESFLQAFRSEWRLHNRAGEPRRVAIVDDAPGGQYLYPEFLLFQRLFEARGIAAVIAAPEDLDYRDGVLLHGGLPVDLVYNRLTDFDLSDPRHAALREAYRSRAAVVTPSPWAHAYFADKRNLTLLSDPAALAEWGVPAPLRATLARGIPRTVVVTEQNAEDLWAKRDELFFKPSTGYGGKAAYRGDKLTRKTWAGILTGSYVAQALVPPSDRAVAIDGGVARLKTDLRCYTYAGRVQLIAARLYSGQTTNFRTPGGGFAPVFVSDDPSDCAPHLGGRCGEPLPLPAELESAPRLDALATAGL